MVLLNRCLSGREGFFEAVHDVCLVLKDGRPVTRNVSDDALGCN